MYSRHSALLGKVWARQAVKSSPIVWLKLAFAVGLVYSLRCIAGAVSLAREAIFVCPERLMPGAGDGGPGEHSCDSC